MYTTELCFQWNWRWSLQKRHIYTQKRPTNKKHKGDVCIHKRDVCINKRHLPPVRLWRIQTKETYIVHKRNIYIHKRDLLIRTQKRRIYTQKISGSSGTRDDTQKRLLILHARDSSINIQKRRRYTPKKLPICTQKRRMRPICTFSGLFYVYIGLTERPMYT